MAAVAITDSFGVPMEKIREVVKRFVAVEHRIEFTAEINGVKYYNDSKGTNTDAAIKASWPRTYRTCMTSSHRRRLQR